MEEFIKFPKIARLSREVVVTEKLDGTNATVYITEGGEFYTASRTRWITPSDDNYGFSRWAHENKDDLMTLGPGYHRGEWWGKKIQRGYDLQEKRFSLFNTSLSSIPNCCSLVPVLYQGPFNTSEIDYRLEELSEYGSAAAPGYMNPEGIIVYHIKGNVYFKKTLDHNDGHKGV